VSPAHKRQIAGIFVNRGLCSERSACRHFGLHRSTFQYEAKQPNAWLARLKIALKRMSRLHPELPIPRSLVYSTIRAGRSATGFSNACVEGVGGGQLIPPKKPRRRRQGISTGLPTKAAHPTKPRLDLGLRPRHHDAGR